MDVSCRDESQHRAWQHSGDPRVTPKPSCLLLKILGRKPLGATSEGLDSVGMENFFHKGASICKWEMEMEWEISPAKNHGSFCCLQVEFNRKRGEGEERKLKQPPLCTDCIAGEALSVARHNSCLLRGSFPGDFPWDSFIHLSLTPGICITRSQRELLV